MNNKVPHVGQYIDEEEKELIEAIENDDSFIPKRLLTEERRQMLIDSAKAKSDEIRTAISIRVRESDLKKLKEKAKREGIPYQTLINSILHKAVSD